MLRTQLVSTCWYLGLLAYIGFLTKVVFILNEQARICWPVLAVMLSPVAGIALLLVVRLFAVWAPTF